MYTDVDETFWESMTWKYEWNDHKSQVKSGNLESLVAKASLLIGKRAGYHDDGSKDCFFNNITLCYIVLILNTVKDLIVSHLDLTDVWRPTSLQFVAAFLHHWGKKLHQIISVLYEINFIPS
jgi:hypothetical protein